jgi:hypothetical protein
MKKYDNTQYQVDKNGSIYRNGKGLKPLLVGGGYHQVILYHNGSKQNKYIHRLVAECFIPNPNNHPEVNHMNGIKTDNRVENLEWVTSGENKKHAFLLGLRTDKAEKHYRSKLKMDEVEYIRKNYIPRDKVFGCNSLAKRFNVSPSAISFVINNKNWKDN